MSQMTGTRDVDGPVAADCERKLSVMLKEQLEQADPIGVRPLHNGLCVLGNTGSLSSDELGVGNHASVAHRSAP
jgi:hypothetical protein